jgi:hypothetical protein
VPLNFFESGEHKKGKKMLGRVRLKRQKSPDEEYQLEPDGDAF